MKQKFLTFIFSEQIYNDQEIQSGCAIGDGRFHQRCDCKKDVGYCKEQCDASEACKGYAGPIQNNVSNYWGCQFATTDDYCPKYANGTSICALLDLGVVGDLSRISKTRSPGYLGCKIKLSRRTHQNNPETLRLAKY